MERNIENILLNESAAGLFHQLETQIADIEVTKKKSDFNKHFKYFKFDWMIEHQNINEVNNLRYIYACVEKLRNLEKNRIFSENTLKKLADTLGMEISSEEKYGIMPPSRFAPIEEFQKKYVFAKNSKLGADRFIILHSKDKRSNFLFYKVFNTFNFYYYIFNWGDVNLSGSAYWKLAFKSLFK